MQNIVISSSAKNQTEINNLINKLKNNYNILDYAKPGNIEDNNFNYIDIYKEFYSNILKTDIFLLFNYDKNGISGHIGAAGFSELNFAILQKVLFDKNIEIYIYKMPDPQVACFEEVNYWIEKSYINLWHNID